MLDLLDEMTAVLFFDFFIDAGMISNRMLDTIFLMCDELCFLNPKHKRKYSEATR
jgi:hypothetical protein